MKPSELHTNHPMLICGIKTSGFCTILKSNPRRFGRLWGIHSGPLLISWASVGLPLGSLWAPLRPLESSWASLVPSWAPLEVIGASLGSNLVHFGFPWTPLDALWDPLGSILTICSSHGVMLTSNERFGTHFGTKFKQMCFQNPPDCINPDKC